MGLCDRILNVAAMVGLALAVGECGRRNIVNFFGDQYEIQGRVTNLESVRQYDDGGMGWRDWTEIDVEQSDNKAVTLVDPIGAKEDFGPCFINVGTCYQFNVEDYYYPPVFPLLHERQVQSCSETKCD